MVTPPDAAATATAASATAATAIAAYDAKQWDVCAEQWMAVAKTSTTAKQQDALYNGACCYAQDGKADRAFAALDASIAAGFRDVANLEKDTDLVSLHRDARWAKTVTAMKDQRDAWEKSLKDPQLRRQLLALFAEDQAARNAWNEKYRAGDKNVDMAPVAAIDKKSSKALEAAIAKHGWPGKSIVGEDGAHAAWLLVQHADHDRNLQKAVLARMKPMVESREVTSTDYAYLYDRVAVGEKRKQLYGTQFDNGEPAPIEDEANVDARRKDVGLGTMAEYRQQMLKAYGPPKLPTTPAAQNPAR